MSTVYVELCQIVAEAEARGIAVVVIGAFAVRAYLVRPDRRVTQDIDVLVREEDLAQLREVLESRGYRLYPLGPWWRAERGAGADRSVVDVAIGAVVDVGSFEAYPLDPGEASRRAEPNGVMLPVPCAEDVVALKLLAHRDKDALDLIALMRDLGAIDAAVLTRRIEARDLEIPIRRGYLEIAAAAESGELLRLWARRSSDPLSEDELAKALARLHGLLR